MILGLILLPFLSGEGEKSWKRRPIAVLTVLLIAITLGTFTHLGPVRAVESADERLERRSRARTLRTRDHRARTPGRARLPGQAVPQLPLSWETAEDSEARPWTLLLSGSRRTSSSAR